MDQRLCKLLVEQQVPRLELLLGLNAPDSRSEVALETTLQQIATYLHCDSLPKELDNIWLLITVAQWKEGLFGGSLAVSSLSRGDVSTTFTTPSQRNGDGFYGYKSTLDGYRKLRR